MLNREKEGLLTDMYEGLEYQVLEDLCNEWEFDNDVSVGKFVEQRIDRPFPSEEEACKMLDMRVFCAWMDKDCELGKYEEFIRSSSDKEDSEAILTRCKEELCGDLYCLRARRLSGEFLVIPVTSIRIRRGFLKKNLIWTWSKDRLIHWVKRICLSDAFLI